MKNIFAINGSASNQSSNGKLIDHFIDLTKDSFDVTVFSDLKTLPHFDPERSLDGTPKIISDFRNQIISADGVFICTPEYVFSIPSGLKNAIEWCISTTIFSGKPTGLVTASANGEKGHEEMRLILKTVMAKFTPDTTLLIQGIKGKINEQGRLTDSKAKENLLNFIEAFKKLIENPG